LVWLGLAVFVGFGVTTLKPIGSSEAFWTVPPYFGGYALILSGVILIMLINFGWKIQPYRASEPGLPVVGAGLGILVLGILVGDLLFPAFNHFEWTWVDRVLANLFALSVFVAVTQYKLFRIRTAVHYTLYAYFPISAMVELTEEGMPDFLKMVEAEVSIRFVIGMVLALEKKIEDPAIIDEILKAIGLQSEYLYLFSKNLLYTNQWAVDSSPSTVGSAPVDRLDVSIAIAQAIRPHTLLIRSQGVDVVTIIETEAWLNVDSKSFHLLLSNLIHNAAKHQGKLWVDVAPDTFVVTAQFGRLNNTCMAAK